MICPECNTETSDMLTRCEYCGHPLYAEGEPGRGGGVPGVIPLEPLRDPGPSSTGPAVSEWPRPGGPVGGGGGKRGAPWYLSPWPYLVGIVVVAVVVGGLLLFRKSPEDNPGIVVGNRPTLLDFYNDS